MKENGQTESFSKKKIHWISKAAVSSETDLISRKLVET